ncbi:DUF1330 domain-containing protein [Planktotalea arctica]
MFEFPDVAALKVRYDSSEYASARGIRVLSATCTLVAVEASLVSP